MEQQQILEGDKIIAEFMGHRVSYGLQNAMLISTEDITYTPAKYHTSWDWIMPVVDKIGNIKGSEAFKMTERLRETLYWVEIETTWQCVVDFIKWYNNQTKNS